MLWPYIQATDTCHTVYQIDSALLRHAVDGYPTCGPAFWMVPTRSDDVFRRMPRDA